MRLRSGQVVPWGAPRRFNCSSCHCLRANPENRVARVAELNLCACLRGEPHEMPFHEKAGRSQVDSSWFWLVILFFPSRVATVATLPSALFDEGFLFARCQLGVLVSAGAAT